MTTGIYAEEIVDVWDGTSDTSWYNDTDTEFTITTAEQLAGLAELVDSGNTFEGKTVKLGNSIDLYAKDEAEELISFDPIGSYKNDKAFKGIFDGQEYTIYNLHQNTWALDNGYYYSDLGLGLFGAVEDSEIKNLTMQGAEISGESAICGTVAATAYGDCVFENITVSDSVVADYQYYAGGIVGWASGDHQYVNCCVDETTVIAAQWGDFDNSTGGVIGGCGGSATIYMKDCYVACRIDAFNDVTSSYQWYAYRRCGMLIGNPGKTAVNGDTTYASAPQLTAENCTVVYGDWAHYTYCEFAGTSWPYVRVQAGYSNSAYSNPRYGHPTDANGNTVVDDNHVHNEGEDHFIECTFNQLYGGGQGVYGEPAHSGVTVIHTDDEPVASMGRSLYLSLADAISAANECDGGTEVVLLKDITLSEKLTVTGDITISGDYTITRAYDYTGTLFEVKEGASLTLDGGLVIDGANNWTLNKELYNKALNLEVTGVTWSELITSEENAPEATAPMFKVTGSVVAKNVTIQNNYSSKSSNNGDYGVFQIDANATLTMTGATVKHIVTGGANSVAHLSANSVWTINEGTLITDNFAGKNGGVCRNDSGLIVMNGGRICTNYGINTNGTVVMLYKGSMEMNGGTICHNNGISGVNNGRCAPIYGHSTSTFVMNDGTIKENQGISYGGVDVPSSIKVEINGGYVADNISSLGNTNADLNGNSNTVITGGTFTQNVSQWMSEDSLLYLNEDGTYSVYSENEAPKDKDSLANIFSIMLLLKNRYFTVTAEALEGGSISLEGVTEVKYGESITYVINPDEGYEIACLTVDGEDLGPVCEYTFSDVKEEHTITVSFIKK